MNCTPFVRHLLTNVLQATTTITTTRLRIHIRLDATASGGDGAIIADEVLVVTSLIIVQPKKGSQS